MDIMKGLYAAVLTSMLVLSGCLHEQPETATGNTYYANDADASATSGASDMLMRLDLRGGDSLSWSLTTITLASGDNVFYCSLGDDGDCKITQQGGHDDNSWEPGEVIFLSESGTDICSDSSCFVHIYVAHDGDIVTGDDSIIVN